MQTANAISAGHVISHLHYNLIKNNQQNHCTSIVHQIRFLAKALAWTPCTERLTKCATV